MKVEILVEFKHDKDIYFPGEIVITDDATCEYWCRAGWVKDLDNNIPTSTPSVTDTVLFVKDITEPTQTLNIGE